MDSPTPPPRTEQILTYIAVTAVSHDGSLRDHNEDSLLVGPWTICAVSTRSPQTLVFPLVEEPIVVAVADGLGGHPAGELASTVVVESLSRVAGLLRDEETVREAIRGCNLAVYEQASLDVARTAMGSTVAGVVISRDAIRVFNVGDSRVYAVTAGREPNLERASEDDSPPLADGQTHTSIVTQTLGGSPALTEVQPHVVTRNVERSTRYLVCSDGLSDVVSDSEIATTLEEHTGAEAVFRLWEAAIKAGGPDNITIALVELVEPSAD